MGIVRRPTGLAVPVILRLGIARPAWSVELKLGWVGLPASSNRDPTYVRGLTSPSPRSRSSTRSVSTCD
ncbi:hypothetical protein PF010_g32905 [Phytophthora fragariae]|uniref:Uncharacterized protein n=1 Tax=Phytophthora fragariae TaxID=53985 RepID=A0A6A3G9Z5_9STRA|nr:hypothetical protein PF011_g33129 [Phytophthora fragariae]KAE9053443.1 hypothetical protein PF010_g32905 [Phytophthora fragariae]